MSTKRNLYKEIDKTYKNCENLQFIKINEFKKKDTLRKVITEQDNLKNKYKFYKGLLKHWKEENKDEEMDK